LNLTASKSDPNTNEPSTNEDRKDISEALKTILAKQSRRRSMGNPSRSTAKIKKLLSEDYLKNEEKPIYNIPEAPAEPKPEPLKPLDFVPLEDLLTEIATNARNDPLFATYFVLASDYFLEPIQLLNRTTQFYEALSDHSISEQSAAKMRLANTLGKVMHLKPKVYKDPECANVMKNFVQTLSANGNQIDKELSGLLMKRIDFQNIGQGDDVNKKRMLSTRLRTSGPISYRIVKFDLLEEPTRDIAEQFTYICSQKFIEVPLDVLMKKRFEKETDKHETPLGKFIGFFNESSRWVCTQIIMATNEERPLKIAKFIMIMRELWKLNNFNGVMIIYSALNNGSVAKFVDQALPVLPNDVVDSFNQVKKLMDHHMNFKSYREALDAAKGACIPYFALFFRDLLHLEELDTYDENGLINWHKLSSIGKIIWRISQYQQVPYEVEAINHIQRYFSCLQRNATILNDAELYEMSRVVSSLNGNESTRVEVEDDSEEESSEDVPNDLLRSESLYQLPTPLMKRIVSTPDGRKVEFGSLVSHSTVLFIFLRHFGCVLGRRYACELTMIKSTLDKLGVRLVVVGSGTPGQALLFKEDFNFDVDLYVDEARHLFDDFKCHRGWVKGVLNSKTQALNAEARALGYTQGPIQGDILQLGGSFIIKDGKVMYEHIEKFAGDLTKPIECLKRLGATTEMVEELCQRHPQLRPKAKKVQQKIRSIEKKMSKVSKKLKRLSDRAPERSGSSTDQYAEPKKSARGRSKSITSDKEKEDLMKKLQKYNQSKQKELITELKLEKHRKKQTQEPQP
jgi:hypothetical protein